MSIRITVLNNNFTHWNQNFNFYNNGKLSWTVGNEINI